MGAYNDANWVDVINGIGDRTSQNLDTIYSQHEKRRLEEKDDSEKNRMLHPATSKYLAELLNGNMSPAEAAAAAHDEIDAGSAIPNVGGYAKLTEPGEQGSDSASSTQNIDLGAMRASNPRPAPIQRQPPPPPQFTQRDLTQAAQLAPLASARKPPSMGLTYDQRVGLENVKTGNDIKIEGVKQGGRDELQAKKQNGISAIVQAKLAGAQLTNEQNLKFKYYNALLQHQDRLSALENVLQRSRQGIASQEEINRAKIEAGLITSNLNQEGRIFSSTYGIANPEDTDAALGRMKSEIETRAQAVQKELDASRSRQKAGPGQQGGSDSIMIKMRFPDGSTHDVDPNKLDAALKKGGIKI